MVFDCAFGNVKPKFPLVAPFIAGAGHQLHDFHRSLASLRCKRARSKLCNLMSNFPLLPRKDFHRGLPAVRSRRPDILCQGHHSIRCQLVDLDLESTQDLRHESMRRQTKASGEKGLEDDQLAFWLGDHLRPRDTRHLPPKYPSCCMLCTRTKDIRDTPNSIVSPGCNSSAATLLSVSSDDAPAGSVSAAEEEEDGMATYRRRRRAVCFTRARSPTSRSKEGRRAVGFKRRLGFCGTQKEYLTRAAPPPFIYRTRRFGKPAVQQCHVHQRSHQKPPRNHFERGQHLHHLAKPSAPDDLVKLVPRRANVGAKAKTPPFARCLRWSHQTNGG
jgi:hypothetical protein